MDLLPRNGSGRESGFSLVEMLVALAISGLSCLALMQMGTVQGAVQTKIREKLSLVQLRASIHQRISCAATVDVVCRQGVPQLISRNGPFELAQDPEKRHLVIRPFCEQDNVYVAYSYSMAGQPALDPVTKQVERPRLLFPGPLCTSHEEDENRNCAADSYPTGYDFDTKRYTCSRTP